MNSALKYLYTIKAVRSVLQMTDKNSPLMARTKQMKWLCGSGVVSVSWTTLYVQALFTHVRLKPKKRS